jgi:hypothetical protein
VSVGDLTRHLLQTGVSWSGGCDDELPEWRLKRSCLANLLPQLRHGELCANEKVLVFALNACPAGHCGWASKHIDALLRLSRSSVPLSVRVTPFGAKQVLDQRFKVLPILRRWQL